MIFKASYMLNISSIYVYMYIFLWLLFIYQLRISLRKIFGTHTIFHIYSIAQPYNNFIYEIKVGCAYIFQNAQYIFYSIVLIITFTLLYTSSRGLVERDRVVCKAEYASFQLYLKSHQLKILKMKIINALEWPAKI